MRIFLECGDVSYQKESERLVRLFFEDDEIIEEDKDAAIHIRLEIVERGDGFVTAKAILHDRRDGRREESIYEKPVMAGADDAEFVRRGRQAILRVAHDVCEQVAGEGQPWGILSGVRPLKLVHAMREEGRDDAFIRHRLRDEFRLTPERIELLLEIESVQAEVVPDLFRIDKEVSIYIGIPFCPTHCAYCTFPAYSMEDKATYAPSFLDAMEREFVEVGKFLHEKSIPVTSIYLGGGTPTSLMAPELERVMKMIYSHIPDSDKWREFTVEAGRPDTITPERVEVMRRYGVNRITVNPQTYKAETLKTIGRGHTPDIVDKRFHLVREAGFENINMDMIIGLPFETVDDVRYTRERLAALMPDSVTVHTLQFKRTAAVNKDRENFGIPTTGEVRQMMRETNEWARELGYHPYYTYRSKDILGNLENVGYAQPGKDSVYNVCIMEERQTIVGLGGGASTKLYQKGGFLKHVYNPKEPKAYVDMIDSTIEKKLRALRDVFDVEEAPRSV
jgi:oxygen-independent coproporphyrinogen III oxidase